MLVASWRSQRRQQGAGLTAGSQETLVLTSGLAESLVTLGKSPASVKLWVQEEPWALCLWRQVLLVARGPLSLCRSPALGALPRHLPVYYTHRALGCLGEAILLSPRRQGLS